MDNNELLQQVIGLMQEQTETISKVIDTKIKESEARLEARLEARIDTKIKESETRIMVVIEHDITKRIDALVDGYKLNTEKQWELERRVEKIEQKLGMAI